MVHSLPLARMARSVLLLKRNCPRLLQSNLPPKGRINQTVDIDARLVENPIPVLDSKLKALGINERVRYYYFGVKLHAIGQLSNRIWHLVVDGRSHRYKLREGFSSAAAREMYHARFKT